MSRTAKTTLRLSLTLLLAASYSPAPTLASESSTNFDQPLASSKAATVTVGDFRADLLRLPEELRGQVLVSQRRIATVLHNLLKAKTLAAEARKLGLDQDPLNKHAIALGTDRVLTALYYDHLHARAGKEFDAQIEAHTRHAREIYTIQTDRFVAPEQVRAAHILIDTKTRKRDEAQALAQKIRDQLVAGADFATLASAHSDDPGSKAQGGDLGFFEAGGMVKGFSEEAFRLSAKEPLGNVVESQYGFHVIKFVDRKPARKKTFDEVKSGILSELRQKFVSDAFRTMQSQFETDQSIEIDEKAVDTIYLKITPEMLRAAAAADGKNK